MHHFGKINQTIFLETSFQLLKTGKKVTFLWPLSKKYRSFKVLKNLRFMAMFYWKTKYVQTLSVLLAKNIDKDFSDVKILIAKDHYSFNYIYWFSNKPSP